jgi:hypothetical protein
MALEDLRTDHTVSTEDASKLQNRLDWPMWKSNWLKDLEPGSEQYRKTLDLARIIEAMEGLDDPEGKTSRQKTDLRRKRTTNATIVQENATRKVTVDEVARRCLDIERTERKGRDKRYRQSWGQETLELDLAQQSHAEGSTF